MNWTVYEGVTVAADLHDERPVLENFHVDGDINTPMDELLAHIHYSVRQGHPQFRPEAIKPDRVALVASGPSLNDTEAELRDLIFSGAKVVTVNGAYHWCIERNIRPSAQVVLDARASTARFMSPNVPGCLYLVASQCHPDVWTAVEGRDRVAIFHAINPDNPEGEVLDAFYGKGHWHGVDGGTTVTSRALMLLRSVGYLRFDLFGVDCCWLNGAHHAFEQPENAREKRLRITLGASGSAETQSFECAPWHAKSLEDWLFTVRNNGEHFLLNVHGDGMLAYALRAGARVVSTQEQHGTV